MNSLTSLGARLAPPEIGQHRSTSKISAQTDKYIRSRQLLTAPRKNSKSHFSSDKRIFEPLWPCIQVAMVQSECNITRSYICRCREKASPSSLDSRTHITGRGGVSAPACWLKPSDSAQKSSYHLAHTKKKKYHPGCGERKGNEMKWKKRGMKKGSRLASVLLFVGSHKHTLHMIACTLSVSIYISDFIHISTFFSPAWRVQQQLKDGWAGTCVKNSRSCL